jgi:phosphatidate cytidylyltransferase
LARSNLANRLLAAVVAIPLMLLLIFRGPPWGWFVMVVAAAGVGSLELYGMTHKGDRVSQVLCTLLTLGLMVVLWWFGADAKVLLTVLLAMPIVAILLVLLRLGDIQTAALRVAATAFGPIYLGGGLAAAALLRRDGGADGPAFVLLALMLSWLSDTGAYFAGRFLGKHKLYEAVSPKKTVEGSIGGLLGGVVGALLAHFWYLTSLPLTHAIGLAIVAGGLGQAGDLGESLLKRSFGIKDSGGIIPGHGGILDRVDALLVTSTVTYFYVLWVRH